MTEWRKWSQHCPARLPPKVEHIAPVLMISSLRVILVTMKSQRLYLPGWRKRWIEFLKFTMRIIETCIMHASTNSKIHGDRLGYPSEPVTKQPSAYQQQRSTWWPRKHAFVLSWSCKNRPSQKIQTPTYILRGVRRASPKSTDIYSEQDLKKSIYHSLQRKPCLYPARQKLRPKERWE